MVHQHGERALTIPFMGSSIVLLPTIPSARSVLAMTDALARLLESFIEDEEAPYVHTPGHYECDPKQCIEAAFQVLEEVNSAE